MVKYLAQSVRCGKKNIAWTSLEEWSLRFDNNMSGELKSRVIGNEWSYQQKANFIAINEASIDTSTAIEWT